MSVKAAIRPKYMAFDQLDGRHPWAEEVPDGALLYPVRKLANGKVSYFNFELAREMGLIHESHPNALNDELKEKILDTFCLRIINEYDQENGSRFARTSVKPNHYMATRYLQLQHADKSGRTSGDGRCIWNGTVTHDGQVWDISSRGTGVTALAPGAVEAGRPLKTGNNDHGYGCGMAEIDELFAAAILAEIFYRNGVPTERVLAIINLGKGVGIGVRAAPNLLRPAHLFLFLKQGRLEPLKTGTDYLIARQKQNGLWKIKATDPDRYQKMLKELAHSYARFAALLERDYIFAWLDWDGDNVLADAGIIDYGSVRQFGLRHDQYRYDDVERMSTNLNEQRQKARDTIQTFVQMVDYLETSKKKPWRSFGRHACLKEFDLVFSETLLSRFLYQVGFPKPLQDLLLRAHRPEVEKLYDVHCSLERVKTHRKLTKVADGVHRPAIFNMRMALANMAEYLEGFPAEAIPLVDSEEFFEWILSSQASRRDRKLTNSLRQQLSLWQNRYLKLLRRVTTPATWDKTLAILKCRAAKINHAGRITGNALINIVDEILSKKRRGLSGSELQAAIEDLISAQTLNPDFATPRSERITSSNQAILRSLLTVVNGHREDI